MSKLYSASQLILGMESLIPSQLIPLSKAAFEAASTPTDALDQQRYGMAHTCLVLYTIVIELVLKHIWEHEQGETAKHNHDVYSLFVQLRPKTQRAVKILYNDCCRKYKSAIEDIRRQQPGAAVMAVDMANLENALRWNKEAVKNLKYDMKLRGESVPTGLIWSSKRRWVVPGTFPNFAIELTRWADRNF